MRFLRGRGFTDRELLVSGIAQEGRRGPVLIDLPLDVQKSGLQVDFDPERGGPLRHIAKPEPRPGAIRRAIEMILEAERPILMPGGGVIIADAAEELVELAEYLQIPVSPTYMGKGVIPEDHPLYMCIVGLQTQQRYANALFLESDLVVGIGNRWADRHTGEVDFRALGETGHRLLEEDVVILLVALTQPRQPDDEGRQHSQQNQRHYPHPDVICPRFHSARPMPCPSPACPTL